MFQCNPSTTKLLQFGLGLCLGIGASAYLMTLEARGMASSVCEQLADEPEHASDTSRDAFASTNVPPVTVVQGHTHAAAAGARNAGLRAASEVALRMGAGLYIVQMSRADQRKGHRGSRQWYWPKDTNVANRDDPDRRDDLVYVCDTDYYMDMPTYLADQVKPVLLYTAVPAAATTSDQDSTTHFNAEGELVTMVAGGGLYRHKLWNYGSDSITAFKWFLGIFPIRMVTYAVERKQVSDHRQLILLAPIRALTGIKAVIGHLLFGGNYLERFNPIEQAKDGTRFVRFKVHTTDGTMITTARAGDLLSCTVSASVDDAVATVARLGTTNLMMPTVASWLGKDQRAASTVLTEYHRKTVGKKPPVVFPVQQGVRAYQYEPSDFDQDGKVKLEAFMSPLVHGAFAPVINAASERRSVKGRITDLKGPEPAPSAFRDQCLQEFVNLVSEGMVLEPVNYETVAEQQHKPAQRLSLLRAVTSGPFVGSVLKCFLKSEAYAKLSDPRNISTYNDSDKLALSMFSQALAAYLKKFKWYGPGKTPFEVAERVASICMDADFVNVSDLERMDGTIKYFMRLVDRGILMKTFVNHRAVLNELLNRNCDNTGYLPNGTSFDQGSSHGSGCPFTSVSQTLRSTFNAYLAFRHTKKPNGLFYDPKGAFDALGLHFGDDGLDADLPVASLQWASNKTGLRLKAATVDRGHAGVNFLARYYSEDVWTGRLDSMCDVKRQLSKFHTTVRLPENVLAEYKLVEKCMGFVATDGNTPVIGPLCKRVLVLSSYRPKTPHGVSGWWSKFDNATQFPNSNADGWMDVEFDRQFPEFDHRMFTDWLAGTKSATEILEAPLCAEPQPPKPATVDVVVDDVVVLAAEDAGLAEDADQTPVKKEETSARRKTVGARHDPKRKSRSPGPQRPKSSATARKA